MKVLISDNLHAKGVAIFEQAPNIEVINRPGMPPDEFMEVVQDVDGLVIRSATKVTDKVLEVATRLKVVGRAGTGLDNVNIPEATKRGVVVMNTPGGNTVTTGEHALSMMLALARTSPRQPIPCGKAAGRKSGSGAGKSITRLWASSVCGPHRHRGGQPGPGLENADRGTTPLSRRRW